jgi:hypothetical protein
MSAACAASAFLCDDSDYVVTGSADIRRLLDMFPYDTGVSLGVRHDGVVIVRMQFYSSVTFVLLHATNRDQEQQQSWVTFDDCNRGVAPSRVCSVSEDQEDPFAETEPVCHASPACLENQGAPACLQHDKLRSVRDLAFSRDGQTLAVLGGNLVSTVIVLFRKQLDGGWRADTAIKLLNSRDIARVAFVEDSATAGGHPVGLLLLFGWGALYIMDLTNAKDDTKWTNLADLRTLATELFEPTSDCRLVQDSRLNHWLLFVRDFMTDTISLFSIQLAAGVFIKRMIMRFDECDSNWKVNDVASLPFGGFALLVDGPPKGFSGTFSTFSRRVGKVLRFEGKDEVKMAAISLPRFAWLQAVVRSPWFSPGAKRRMRYSSGPGSP